MTASSRTKVAALVSAVGAVTIVSATSANAADAGPRTPASSRVVIVHEPLRDLQPTTADAVDGASAVAVLVQRERQTIVALHVTGVDQAAAGRRFGAHVHVGPCVAGDGAAAGPHYNSDTAVGQVPPRVDASTEVWLDFTATAAGKGTAVTQVPFLIQPGQRSIVIHRDPTDHHGAAGPRLACIPLSL